MPYNFDRQYPPGHQPPPQHHPYQQPGPPFYQQPQQHAAPPYQLPAYQFPSHQHHLASNPHQPPIHHQSQSQYQLSPQPASNFQVVVPSRQESGQYEVHIPAQQHQQYIPQRPPDPSPHQQFHQSVPYQRTHQQSYQQSYHQTSPHQQHRQPQSQSGHHHNQQFVPPQQTQYYHQQEQQSVNGHPAMPSSQPSPRPTSRPQQTQQNGHVPTPPTRAPTAPKQSATPPVPESEYPILLLSLADEYLIAAGKINKETDFYFKLIATGLGCLESVLTNFKLPPLREAQLSLRHAQVLYEETENYDDAERVMTKAIDICERNKFIDLKYTLQLLQACVLYQSKPKAAIKDLQTMLEEIEAYKHTAWGYAARYQLAMFYLSAASVRDLHNAIHHMEKLSNSANANGDRPVAAFAEVVSSSLYLQTSSPDAVSSSQQALAKARALSTSEEVSSLSQIMLMMEFVDLCCSIQECNHMQCDEKRRRMQDVWTAIVDKEGWIRDSDMMFLPIKKSSLRGVQLQLGGLVREKDGQYLLPFSWLETNDAEAWGFLLCAITKAHKNASDGGKAEQFTEHGLQRTRDATGTLSGGMAGVTSLNQKILECRFLVEFAFLKCEKGEWDEANQAVDTIDKVSKEVGAGFPPSMTGITEYLRGSIQQGSGNLDAALEIYQMPMFDLSQFIRGPEPSVHHRSHDSETETIRNIAILAAMNRLLIINDPSHPQHNRSSSIIEQLNTLVKASQDKNIQASYTLIHSLITQTGILRSKQSLIAALNSAKAIANGQITALVLMTMHQKHFIGVTDEHAVKCVRATSMQMRNWGNPMWMHVTAGVEAEALEFQGKLGESEAKMGEARRRAEGLPGRIREMVRM